MPPRLILAIDPGPEESAWCVYGGERLRFEKQVNAELLADILTQAERFAGCELAIEMIASYGMAVGREVFETCLWIGRFMQAAACEVRLVYRAEVKIHLCQSMKAKDANIRQALIDKFGPPGTKKNPGRTYKLSGDCWSALAVAVTAMETPAKPENLRR